MGLPVLYDRWAKECLGVRVPEEQRATCGSCPLVLGRPFGSEDIRFDESTKCCTYLPELPNYLVGLALAGGGVGPETASMGSRLSLGSGVTPLGVGMTPLYALIYKRAVGVPPGAFGRSPSLRCPHYVQTSGRCDIWQARNAVCATWHCRYNAGKNGATFWAGVRSLFRIVEEEMAIFVALRLGIASRVIGALMEAGEHSPEEVLSKALVEGSTGRTNADMWGEWVGKEEEYFLAGGRIVADMPWEEVRRACGARLAVQESKMRELVAMDARSGSVVVRLGFVRIHGTLNGLTRVSSYSQTDTVDIPSNIMGALLTLTWPQSLNGLAAKGITLEVATSLLDQGILVSGEPEPTV